MKAPGDYNLQEKFQLSEEVVSFLAYTSDLHDKYHATKVTQRTLTSVALFWSAASYGETHKGIDFRVLMKRTGMGPAIALQATIQSLQSPTQNQFELNPGRIDPELRDRLKRAELLAKKTTGSLVIEARHLIFSLLPSDAEESSYLAPTDQNTQGFAARLRKVFIDHLHSHYPDEDYPSGTDPASNDTPAEVLIIENRPERAKKIAEVLTMAGIKSEHLLKPDNLRTRLEMNDFKVLITDTYDGKENHIDSTLETAMSITPKPFVVVVSNRLQATKRYKHRVKGLTSKEFLTSENSLLTIIHDGLSGTSKDLSKPQPAGQIQKLIENALPHLASAKFGNKIYLQREAPGDQSCLNVNQYAEVIADTLLAAGKEDQSDDTSSGFCLGVFGNWGRGKTYLIRKVSQVLQSKAATESANPGVGHSSKDAAHYETVFFSAWKYPRAPEIWVQLYESLARQFETSGFFVTTARTLRTNIAKFSSKPLLIALALFTSGITPLALKIKFSATALSYLAPILGASGLLLIAATAFQVRKTIARLHANYLKRSNHTNRLGLQSIIGKDLDALLKGWIPLGDFPILWPSLSYAAIAFTCCVVIFNRLTPSTVVEYTLSLLPAVLFLSVYVWIVAVGSKRPSKILLVVDDLDRCPHNEMLTIIESIKLLLDEPTVSKRVQVIMLAEEELLNHAILQKYASLHTVNGISVSGTRNYESEERDSSPPQNYTKSRIVRETKEKLFTVHLRMPPLSQEDFLELFDHIALSVASNPRKTKRREKEPANSPRMESSINETHAAQTAAGPELTEHIRILERRKSGSTSTDDPGVSSAAPLDKASHGDEESNLILESAEVELLRSLVPSMAKTGDGSSWGPRSLRCFFFRYQIARRLLGKIGASVTPRQLIDELAAASGLRSYPREENFTVRSVVQQVSSDLDIYIPEESNTAN